MHCAHSSQSISLGLIDIDLFEDLAVLETVLNKLVMSRKNLLQSNNKEIIEQVNEALLSTNIVGRFYESAHQPGMIYFRVNDWALELIQIWMGWHYYVYCVYEGQSKLTKHYLVIYQRSN